MAKRDKKKRAMYPNLSVEKVEKVLNNLPDFLMLKPRRGGIVYLTNAAGEEALEGFKKVIDKLSKR